MEQDGREGISLGGGLSGEAAALRRLLIGEQDAYCGSDAVSGGPVRADAARAVVQL